MEFAVITARVRGRLVPQWQLGTRSAHIGELTLHDVLNEHLRRHSRQAILVDYLSGMRCEGLPALWDAQLSYASREHWVMTGFEQIDEDTAGRVDYAQTWILTPADRLTGAQAIKYNRERISGIRR